MNTNKQVKIKTAIIGGGASGLFLATSLCANGGKIALFERGERVCRKLSATGNGQGNITNASVKTTPYFSFSERGGLCAEQLVRRYDEQSLCGFFQSLGLLIFFDERGRGYPTGRQASALTDALRFCAQEKGVLTYTGKQITDVKKIGDIFLLTAANGERFESENVVLCTGGKAAKNFGTDGTGYTIAQKLGHTLTPLYPSLVQLKTDLERIRSLKGIRVFDAAVTAKWQGQTGEQTRTIRGDIIFTDYGVSGDAVFRLSAFIADKKDAVLSVDFLPDVAEGALVAALRQKRKAFPTQERTELLCGIVNNQIGRAIMKTADDERAAANGVKSFPLRVRGTLGFDYAQVTKGGIKMDEVDENLQSKKVKGLYFAGEILDVDGECGGFNLQWAYASARTVAAAIDGKMEKGQG
ncbi:MAG: aminoacetone oxidase family FAD-binding enzyme [Clostridia bacterium]|nr:aminoacetone oxidase family FAD-binding enzyme [Clostridia bacterium]